jgi:hypothetical protein
VGAQERARGGRPGRLAVGPRSGARDPRRGEKEKSFPFYFLKNSNKNSFWSILKAFSRGDLKTKVAPFLMLYNFALKTKVRFLLDFEIQN